VSPHPEPFVHLQLHSEYSLRDSTIRIPDLVARAAALGQPAVALTDRNNLFALVKFYTAAERAGIKPIVGCDLSLHEGDAAPWPLTVLCRDHAGYLALSHLLTRAWLEGHHDEGVAVAPDWLSAACRDSANGLFLLAGHGSLAGVQAQAGRHELALDWLRQWQGQVGDRLHLALTRSDRDGEEPFNAFALDAASRLGIPLIASNDVRFLDPDGYEAHEARVCIAEGRVLNDPRRPRHTSREQWMKDAAAMAARFADAPDALANTLALAERCNLELRLGSYVLPAFPVPSEHTLESWIRRQASDGLAARLEHHPLAPGRSREDYTDRLTRELDVIVQMGFPGYFLIVADFIQEAKRRGIPVGPGRGSGAASLVAWALGITDLDPLPYDLLFERFLNPERVSMPDFDIDFCMDRRDEVIDYVAGKYGRDRVSQIITYGSMAAKAVLRDAGRVLGLPYGFVDSVAKLIPLQPTDPLSLEDALGRSARAQKGPNYIVAEFKQRYENEDDVRDLVDLALQLEDLVRNAGKHAGGVVIAPSPLSDFCPLFAEHDAGNRGKNPVTQLDKDDVEAVGLVKFDFLGLRTLTIIDWAMKAINERRRTAGEPPLEIGALPLDDADTFALFARGNTVAVFQFESRGMRELLRRAKPDTFEDIIALGALFRPGPLGSGMDRDWTDRKHGLAEVSYPHPLLEAVLKPTYGVIVYQEQVMQIAQVLAGYSLGGADLLRRAMGKKKPEEMAKERAKFEAGAAARGVEPRTASQIFDLMEKFAEYGFNKSHSAAYALVAYQTAWLKVHYPAEFMAATLSADMDNTDKVVSALDEACALGLTVLPPDVNRSGHMFAAVATDTIRYGLGAVKGVGRGACEAIVAARESGGEFRDLLDLCERSEAGKLNKRALEALIQAGATDALCGEGGHRAALMLQLPEVVRLTEQRARARDAGQVSLFGGDAQDPAGDSLAITLPTCPPWPLSQLLRGERDTLGHYLSGHPLDPIRDDLRQLVGHDLGELDRLWRERPEEVRRNRRADYTVVLAGMVVAQRRRGDSQSFVVMDDGRGRVECGFFAEALAEHAALLSNDTVLVVEGALREDEFSGSGFTLRVRRAWDYPALCAEHAERLSLRVDLRQAQALADVERLLAGHRPGRTPIRLDLLARGTAGTLELDATRGVRVAPELIERLRHQPGVQTVRLNFSRPWTP
jgi:DNA polymerase-3 subunit alpha